MTKWPCPFSVTMPSVCLCWNHHWAISRESYGHNGIGEMSVTRWPFEMAGTTLVYLVGCVEDAAHLVTPAALSPGQGC